MTFRHANRQSRRFDLEVWQTANRMGRGFTAMLPGLLRTLVLVSLLSAHPDLGRGKVSTARPQGGLSLWVA